MARIDVVVLPGDGVGPEVSEALITLLGAVADAYGHEMTITRHAIGWSAFEDAGTPLPDDTLRAALEATATFVGAVGDPRSKGLPPESRPEAGLLRLRAGAGCYANLRPARIDAELVALSTLRPEIAKELDLLVVRELIGGLYYGEPRYREAATAANTMIYDVGEVERITRVAFEVARDRGCHVTSVDKANVLEVSQLWRDVVCRVGEEYPDVSLDHMLVDRAAMELVTDPGQFDVVLTSNCFGDILSDAASALCGSQALLASASVGGDVDIYETVHGPLTDVAGTGVANPIGAFRCGALMLSRSFGLHAEADAVEAAIVEVLESGTRTRDLAKGGVSVDTTTFTEAVVAALPRDSRHHA